MTDEQKIDLINHRKQRAYNALEEVEKLLDQKMLFLAMNRVYYAGFYIVMALSLLDNFSTSKHHQLIGYFNKYYLHTGKLDKTTGSILNISFGKRNSVDYQDYATITKDEILKYYELMKIFVKKVDEIIQQRIQQL